MWAGLPGEVLNCNPLKCKSICQSADSPFTILPCGDRVFKNGFHAHLKIPGAQTGWVPGREGVGRATLLSSPVPSQLHDTAPSKLGAPALSLAAPPAVPPNTYHCPIAAPKAQLILGCTCLPKWLLLLTPGSYPRSPLPHPNPRPLSEAPRLCTRTPSALALQRALGPLLHQGEACRRLYLWTPPSAHTPPCTHWLAPMVGGVPPPPRS